MWVVMIVSGTVADLLQKKKFLTTTNVRKLASGIGRWLRDVDWRDPLPTPFTEARFSWPTRT